jgi:hypothetical protein
MRLPKATSGVIDAGDASVVVLPLGDGLPDMRLSSGAEDVPLKAADTFYVVSDGWPTADAAGAAADKHVGTLMRVLARMRIGVDAGSRQAGGGGFTKWLIDKMWDEQGLRVLNERPGLMVYESDPQPVFASMGATAQLGYHASQFEELFAAADSFGEQLTTAETVALTLYNAAFFEKSNEARFILRMMSLESLLQPAPRSCESVACLEQLCAQVSASALPQAERDSIIAALGGLRRESIRRTGRLFVESTAGGREYDGTSAAPFFSRCYSIRSRLVHGGIPLPAPEDVSGAAAGLELMLSDILAGRLRDTPMPQVSG